MRYVVLKTLAIWMLVCSLGCSLQKVCLFLCHVYIHLWVCWIHLIVCTLWFICCLHTVYSYSCSWRVDLTSLFVPSVGSSRGVETNNLWVLILSLSNGICLWKSSPSLWSWISLPVQNSNSKQNRTNESNLQPSQPLPTTPLYCSWASKSNNCGCGGLINALCPSLSLKLRTKESKPQMSTTETVVVCEC